jgi:hypothetical protein
MKISIASLTVELKNKYAYTAKLAAEYVSELDPDFSVEATEEQMQDEIRQTGGAYTNGYVESVILYRNIAEKIPSYDGIVFHGAIIAIDGEAYAFTARSGVGKTTHIKLWQQVFGERVHILNGDKPIIRIIDGIPYACGTPWRGKENFGVNEMLPLKGIAFLARGAENKAYPIDATSAMPQLISQMYIPKNPLGAKCALSLSGRIIAAVPLIKIEVNTDPSAAKVVYEAFQSVKNKI